MILQKRTLMTSSRNSSPSLSLLILRIFPLIRHTRHQKKNDFSLMKSDVKSKFQMLLKATIKFFAEWWSSLDFDSKVTITTFSALIPPVVVLGSLHVDDRIGVGVVFGTLLSVGASLIRNERSNKISKTSRLRPQELQPNL